MANPVCCSLLIPFNDSWTLWGPRCPLATDRVFRIVNSWSSVWCNLVCVRVVVSDIVVELLCVLDFANRGFIICVYIRFVAVSPSPFYMFPSALCASYCVIGFQRISTFRVVIISFRILIRSMSRVVVNSFVVQDLQTLMSPRPCYPLVTVVFF